MKRLPPLASTAGRCPSLTLWLLAALLCATTAAADEKIVLQLRWDHQFQFAGYYAALWQGGYAEAGLAVEIRSALTAEGRILSVVEEVGAGRAHFGIGAAEILIANESGPPLSVVATVFQQSAARFFLKAETPFTTLADLTQLRVARRLNDLIDVELQVMLLKEGIDPALMPSHDHQPGIEHLLDDRIQVLPGYTITIPFHRDELGRPFREVRPIDYGVDFYGDSLFTTQAFARREADLVARFKAASMQGWRYALAHPEEVAEKISRDLTRVAKLENPLAFNRFQATAVRKLTLDPIVRLGHINPHRWLAMHAAMRETGLLSDDIRLEALIFDPQRWAAERSERYRKLILWGLGLAGFLLVVSLLWLRAMTSQVAQRTAEIRREESRFRGLATHAPNVIFAVDPDLKVTFINRSLDGTPPASLVGRHIDSLTRKTELEAVMAHIDAVRRTGQPTHYETRSASASGDRWWDVRLAPLKQGERFSGFIFILTDITANKKAADALAESRRRLATLIANLRGIAYRCDNDPDYTMTFVSDGCEALTGYTAADLVGNATISYGELIDPADRQMVWDLIQAALAKRGPFQCTYRIRRADGEQRWVWEQGQGFFDDDDTLVALEGFISDITERKRAEEALASAHERLLTVLNSLDATIYVADMQTYEILFMNEHMIQSFGRDCTGEICWQAFRGESAACAFCTNDELLDDKGRPSGVCTWQDRNPITGRYYINNDRAIEWTDGRMVRLQIATDITDYKQMQEELRQAHKMEAIGTLAGGIAHDFNNILSSIIGFTELALDEADKGSSMDDNLKEVYASGLRAKELVKQILAFARQSEEEMKPLQVNAVVHEVLKLIRSSTPSTIEIREDIDSHALILGNVVHLHQILMNLCTNATHAMSKRGGRLRVSLRDSRLDAQHRLCREGLSPGDYVILSVADDGEGIAPNLLDTIFEPYFTTKATGEGTGMGLAVVHGIIASYEGRITVDSTPGEGTTFRIYLPTTRQRPARLAPERRPPATGRERILFVDDEAAIANMGHQLLTRLGYTVTTRTSSVEALELFSAEPHRFDLVITDMTMPNMTGDLLAARLIELRPGVPVILCTGYSQQITEERALDLGISAFAYKPIVKAELAATVRRVLDEARAG